jgi:hypothetical protein
LNSLNHLHIRLSSSFYPNKITQAQQPLQQFQVPDRKRKFNRSSLYTDTNIPAPLNYNVKNWDDYTAYVDFAAGRQESARELDKKRRYAGERVMVNALS